MPEPALRRRRRAALILAASLVAAPVSAVLAGDPVTREEAPGVVRVVSDGVRDLAGWNVTTGGDDSVWLTSRARTVRFGETSGIEWPAGESSGVLFEVAPDGVVWTVEDVPDKPFVRIRSFDGETWRTHRKVRADSLEGWALEIAPDGRVWATWPDQESRDRERAWIVAYLEPGGWRFLGTPYRGQQPEGLVVTDAGEVWVHALVGGPLRYAEGSWVPARVAAEPVAAADDGFPGVDGDRRVYDGAVGSDGTIWLILVGPPASPMDALGVCDALLHFDGQRWLGYGMPADVADCPGIDVAPDGGAWLTAAFVEGLPGLLRFDGVLWKRYLPDRQVLGHVNFDADGTAWVVSEPADAFRRRQRSIHTITPEVRDPGP